MTKTEARKSKTENKYPDYQTKFQKCERICGTITTPQQNAERIPPNFGIYIILYTINAVSVLYV